MIHGTVSVSEPQAWEENGKWYYNFSGAQAEAEGRGMEIPTAKQWKEIIDDMNLEKLNELLPKDGYRHPQYGNGSTRITGIGSMGGYWTSTKAKKK